MAVLRVCAPAERPLKGRWLDPCLDSGAVSAPGNGGLRCGFHHWCAGAVSAPATVRFPPLVKCFRRGRLLIVRRALRAIFSASSIVLISRHSFVGAFPYAGKYVSRKRFGLRYSPPPERPGLVNSTRPKAQTSRMPGPIACRQIPYFSKSANVIGNLPLSLPPWFASSISMRGRAFIAGKNSIFDEHTGYRYEPNPVDPNFRTNSHGLIAREEFPVEKPADEYRIGVIGASFTANVDSTIRWTDVVEDALNASTAWRVSVGGRRTRVINFGLDGIAFSQYGAVAERIALPFDLDLLIVNVTTNDFVRRPYYRGPLSAMSEAQLSAHITQHIMPRVNWFRFNPEVLAVVTGGRLGLKPHIEMNDLRLRTRFFGTTSEAVEASSASMTTILRLFPETIFLLDHDFIELNGDNNSSLATSARADLLGVSARFPSVKWINVLENQKIPIPTGPDLVAWFNLPKDNHKSDLGVTIYGKAVASLLIARVGSRGEVD